MCLPLNGLQDSFAARWNDCRVTSIGLRSGTSPPKPGKPTASRRLRPTAWLARVISNASGGCSQKHACAEYCIRVDGKEPRRLTARVVGLLDRTAVLAGREVVIGR